MATPNRSNTNFGCYTNRSPYDNNYYRYGYSSYGFSNRGNHRGHRFFNKPPQPHTGHQDHPNNPTLNSSSSFYPKIRSPSPLQNRDNFSNLPIRGRYNHTSFLSRFSHGRRPEDKEFSQHLNNIDDLATQPFPCNIPVTSAYYVDPDCLCTVRQLSDDATLIHAATRLAEKVTPRKKTKSQRDREAAVAERQVISEAAYQTRETKRQLCAAKMAVKSATSDTESALLVLKFAEKAAEEAKSNHQALKQAQIDRTNAEFRQLVVDEKRRAAQRMKPPSLDLNGNMVDVSSDDEGSGEEEDEVTGEISTDEENVDIAFADGLAPMPNLSSTPYVNDDELACLRQMVKISERVTRKQKKARSRDLIHRAELDKLKRKKIQASKKKFKISEKKVILSADSSTNMIASTQKSIVNTFLSSKAAVNTPNSAALPIETEVQTQNSVNENFLSQNRKVENLSTQKLITIKPEKETVGVTDSSINTPSKDNDVPVSVATSKPLRTRRFVIQKSHSANPRFVRSSPPPSRIKCPLEEYVEDERLCRYLGPWFSDFLPTIESESDASSNFSSLKQQDVVDFLKMVKESVTVAERSLAMWNAKMKTVKDSLDD